jgi:hypothetical protein
MQTNPLSIRGVIAAIACICLTSALVAVLSSLWFSDQPWLALGYYAAAGTCALLWFSIFTVIVSQKLRPMHPKTPKARACTPALG